MKRVSKAVITQQEEYLLQLRDDHRDIFYPNQWSFFGGELDLGETPWQALQRELFEELEWRPETGQFLYQWNNPDHPSCVYFFGVRFKGNRDHLILHEGQDLRWFNIQSMSKDAKMASHVLVHVNRFRELHVRPE